MRIYADTGKIAAGVLHAYIPPATGTVTPSRLLLCAPGAGADVPTETIKSKSPGMIRALAFSRAGLAQLWVSSIGADWANDAQLALLETARLWANANLPVKTDQIVTYANSAGNAALLAYAANHPGIVRGHAGTFPVVDIQDIHDNNRQSLAAGIETAANGTAGAIADAWYAARSPVRRQANLTSVPQRFWTSSDDPVALASLAAAHATAVGGSVVDMGALGHSYSGTTPLGPAPVNDIAAWLAARG